LSGNCGWWSEFAHECSLIHVREPPDQNRNLESFRCDGLLKVHIDNGVDRAGRAFRTLECSHRMELRFVPISAAAAPGCSGPGARRSSAVASGLAAGYLQIAGGRVSLGEIQLHTDAVGMRRVELRVAGTRHECSRGKFTLWTGRRLAHTVDIGRRKAMWSRLPCLRTSIAVPRTKMPSRACACPSDAGGLASE